MAISPEIMRLALQASRKQDRSYRIPPHFSNFAPEKLEVKDPANQDAFFNQMDLIREQGQNRTDLERTKLVNRADFRAMRRAERAENRAESTLRDVRAARPERVVNRPGVTNVNVKLGGIGPGGGVQVRGKGAVRKWGADRVPEVSDLGRLRPHGPLVSIRDAQGHSVTVNKQVAPIFRAFLKDLKKTGYKIHSIGGFADRALTGDSSQKSLHAYGFAIDINPSKNPYGSKLITDMPPGIRRLAARYGLSWGGSWRSVKDAMHFSVPYGGRE